MNARPEHRKPIRNVHYVLSTHWDREWYQTFQDYRRRLVRLLDRTIDDFSAGKIKGPFTTDGQAILLQDYLEIRPEREADVRRLVQSGQFKVGPWFVLPDEWLVSGESIVRNLQLGRRIARDFGGIPSDAGFVCDLFGHIGQLPQIFAGFGIKGAFLWRGLEPRPKAQVWWEGSDGTSVLCHRFPRTGYCDYAYDVRHCHQQDVVFDATRADRDLDVYLQKEAAHAAVDPLIVFDGGDHLEYDLEYYQALMGRRTGTDFPYAVRHSTLDQYLDEIIRKAADVQDVVTGELRETGKEACVVDQQWLIPGVLSSRVWIKQANVRCQMLLCHWAEPFSAIASTLCGAQSQEGYLDVAWRWLLMNHPHDSICGCSIDAVHEDMRYRFAQCEQISEGTTQEALQLLVANVAGEIKGRELRVLVANPLTRPLEEAVELTLQIPADWGCFNEFFGFEPKPGFRVFTGDGTEIPYQRVAQDMNRGKLRIHRERFAQGYRTNDITVALPLSIPALGYTTLTVREGEVSAKDDVVPAATLPTRHATTPSLATSERSMENEFLAVIFESNGTLTLTDKRSGQVYSRLLTFEDTADIGDGWYHGQAVNDQTFVSSAAQASIALINDGPLLARFRVRTTLRLPAEFQFERMVRSRQQEDLVIDSLVTLRRGIDRLEVRTTVDNNVRDHRLRVLLPTGAKADSYLADGAFDVVQRPISMPKDNHRRRELAVETRPQQSWTAVADGQRGLAIVAPGLMETAVRDISDRTLALTLFRSTRRTIFTDGQPLGQLPGELTFHYWILPVTGLIDRVALGEAGVLLGSGLRSVNCAPADAVVPSSARSLPAAASFLAVTGGVIISSLRSAAGTLELRCFNPGDQPVEATFDFRGLPVGAPRPHAVEVIDLEGRPLGESAPVHNGIHQLSVRTKKIVTLRYIIQSPR